MAGRDGDSGVDEEEGCSERVNEEDVASVASKIRKMRVRRAPSVCSSTRGSTIAISGLRLRRASQLAGGRKRGPSTPVPSWKLVGDAENTDSLFALRQQHPNSQHRRHHHLQAERLSPATVSARKLAAALWELQVVPFSRGGAPQNRDSRRHHRIVKSSSNAKPSAPHSPASSQTSQMLLKPQLMQNKTEPTRRAFSATSTIPAMKSSMKDLAPGAATSNEFVKLLNHVRTLEEQHRSSSLLVDKLHRELDQSRFQLQELLQNERHHSLEVEEITKKLVGERALWQERQEENVRFSVQSIKEELYHEKKAKSRLESLHKRLVKEFQELKKALGKALHDLERERKARELMEDVCDELAREIGEDKARVEEMRRESAKVREEVEEERKMLQMAEIWREERVQMKLMEAKLELEEKNAALDKLRGELEAFLKAKRAANSDNHAPTNARHGGHNRHVKDVIMGHGLVDPFHPREGRVPARHSIDSRLSNLGGPKQIGQDLDEDDGSSAGEDNLHLTTFSNAPLAKHEDMQRDHFQHHDKDEVDKDRRPNSWKAMVPQRYKLTQGGQHQGLQRSKSSQLREGSRHRDHFLPDMQGTPWTEERAERLEWCEDQLPVSGDGRPETAHSWPSENEGSQGPSSFSPRPGGWRKNGGPYDDGGDNLESSGTNATWLRQIVESSRDLPASSVFAPMHQQLYAKSSPTRHWNHFWSSPDPASPHQGKSKGASEISSSLKDNSLKAKLLEAKLEGQQARLRVSMG